VAVMKDPVRGVCTGVNQAHMNDISGYIYVSIHKRSRVSYAMISACFDAFVSALTDWLLLSRPLPNNCRLLLNEGDWPAATDCLRVNGDMLRRRTERM